MAKGFAEHLGSETEVEALGRKWKLARLTRSVWREFFRWGKEQLPDPLAVAHSRVSQLAREEHALRTDPTLDEAMRKHLIQTNQDEQEFLCREAMNKSVSFLSFNSPEVKSLLGSMDGITYLLYCLLKKYQPDVTEDDAFEIFMEIGQQAAEEAVAQVAGEMPKAGKGEALAA